MLAREAYGAAADPNRYPDQIAEGLPPWQVRKLYFLDGFPFWMGAAVAGGRTGGRVPTQFRPPEPTGPGVSVDLDVYDPLLGRTYGEIGSHARSMHKSQGMSALLTLPSRAVSRYRLDPATTPGQAETDEVSLFAGVDTSIEGLVGFVGDAGAAPPRDLTVGLAEVARHARAASDAFDTGGTAAVRAAVCPV